MTTVDQRESLRRARVALEGGAPQRALTELWALVDRTHLIESELHGYLREMAAVYERLGRRRAVATILLFLGDLDAAARASEHPTDRARVAIAQGRPSDAAQHYLRAGWLGHAAIQLEDAGDDRGARVLWERLAADPRLREDLYTAGLVHFNLSRACERLGDASAAQAAVVRSMHLLEAAADGFEALGLRERAFDCYQILLTIGREGAFENLAEGYLGCIRVLQADNLKYYVLQYYEDFQRLALERGELHAAATLFREAAEFARRHNLPYEDHYRRQAAETLVRAAEEALANGAAPDIAENAFVAAIDAYNDVGAYSAVRTVYDRLAQLDLGEKRQARYARLARRFEGVEDDTRAPVAFPDYLRMDSAYPEIWRLDVVEWEQQGDAAEAMGEVFLDPKWPDFTRRRALLCRLRQLGATESPLGAATLAELAHYLGRVEIYACLAPLEALVEHPEPSVRAACLAAARHLFFKRTFVLVMRGLRDEDALVRRRAVEAVGALHFGHAFDPLQRIYRSSSDPHVRRKALASIGKIPSPAAVELLIDVLRQGDKAERALAGDLLTRSEHPEVDALLQRALAFETGGARAALERVLSARA